MYRKYSLRPILCAGFIIIPLLFTGCSSDPPNDPPAADTLTEEGKRDCTPVIYEPEAPGKTIIGIPPLILDVSNQAEGYVMAKYNGGSEKANIQITGEDGVSYKYFLPPSDSYVPLPLTAGNGTYQIDGYEKISGNEYISLFHETLEVKLENDLLPFLYPSQYVNFNAEALAVQTASETVRSASSDLEAVENIYHFVIQNVVYDDDKAETVSSGYLPDIDGTLTSGKGICFDFAALTAAMLRSQDIPTRLEIGYSDTIYHAWISVWLEGKGWIDNIIEFRGDGWTRMDPTFAAGNGNSEQILRYIGDDSNYTPQYIR